MPIRIYIDQGHNPTGSVNTGAFWYDQHEQDITYQVGTMLAQMLRSDTRFQVLLSRPTADTVLGFSNASSLARRVTQANAWPANYFISIHANSNTNTAINGTEVYIYRANTQANWLAEQVLDGIVAAVGTKNNGVRINPSLYVLKYTQMPAILVELAYLSNPDNAEKLRNDRYAFARGIYNGLLTYFGFS